jgi:hypothetical protein
MTKIKAERGAFASPRLYNKSDFVRALTRLIACAERKGEVFSKLAIDKAREICYTNLASTPKSVNRNA